MQEPLVSSTIVSFAKSKVDESEHNSSDFLKTAVTAGDSAQSASGYIEIPIAPDEEGARA